MALAAAGEPAHTNGHAVFVSADVPVSRQRSEILLQSALLGAGSLDATRVKQLRGRPSVARRYLALEGRRVIADLADQLPLAAALRSGGNASTASSDDSLARARSAAHVAAAPDWFGAIRPSLLLAAPTGPGSAAGSVDLASPPESGDPGEDDSESKSDDSRLLKLFEVPLANSLAGFLHRLFGGSRASGDSTAGADMQVGSVRRVRTTGPDARPVPTRIRFTDSSKPGAVIGVGGAWHPEWDVHRDRYRSEWCRVIDYPLTAAADVAGAAVARDDVLRRRLSRVGLGPTVQRRRADGDELDIEALIDLVVDLRSGFSPPEHVYVERPKRARNLGVLVLLDASGSANDTDTEGLAVHEHQRRAAATLAATLEDLGDRVAVYAFRSQGRHAVHLPAIKTFSQRFHAVARARLNQLEPSGYTRLGAGIRRAGDILKAQAGTPNRLLLVLSDGFPYDDGYEGRYAEADTAKAIEELRFDGVACLCLSVGSQPDTDSLARVFGSASHVRAAALSELSPMMDELFLSALAELAAPTARRPPRKL